MSDWWKKPFDPLTRMNLDLTNKAVGEDNHGMDPVRNFEGKGKYGYSNDGDDPSYEASSRTAGILRRDWDNYLQDYAPYDAQLREMVMGDRDNQAAIDRARGATLASFDASQGALERDRSRLGLSLTGAESKQMKGRTARQRTLAEVGATNRTRLHMRDRDMQMMAGNAAGAGLRDAATNTMRAR